MSGQRLGVYGALAERRAVLTSTAGELFGVHNNAPNGGDQRLRLIGLTSNSSQPVAIAVSRSLSNTYADRPMIGMSRVCGSFLRVRTGSQRSTTGISRSIRITSGRSVKANLQPFSLSLERENLEIADPLKAHLEHVEVVVVVFDVEHFGHDPPLPISSSLDHLVGAGEQRRRHGEAEHLAVWWLTSSSNLVG